MLDRLEEKVLNQTNQQSSLVSAQSLVNIMQMSPSASVLEMATPPKRSDHRPITPFNRQLSQIREQQSEGTMRQGEQFSSSLRQFSPINIIEKQNEDMEGTQRMPLISPPD
jgi:hypothetical protein